METLFYSDEKEPHMWWEEFEKRLNHAYNVYNKVEGREVHSLPMKLRTLLTKVNADFLGHTKAAIEMEMTRTPITLTYAQALANFRNEVNRKFPPEVSSSNYRTRRNINHISRNNRNRNGKRPGPGTNDGNKPKKTKPDSQIIQGNDGKWMEIHPAFKFQGKQWLSLIHI